jgi:signal transduction histidine kinase
METKSKIAKSSSISVFCFLLAVIFWYLLKKFFLWQEGRVILDLIYAFISFSIFIIFSLVYLALIDNRKLVLPSSFFITFSFLFFFLRKEGIWVSKVAIVCYVILIFILFIVFNSANKNLIYERKNSIVFHPEKSILKAAPALMVIFAILFSVVFYFNFPFMDKDGKIAVKEEHLENLTKPFGEAINRYIPIYDLLNMSVDEFIVLTAFIGLPFASGEEEEELKPLVDMEKPPEGIVSYFRNKGVYNLEEVNIIEYIIEDEEFRGVFIEEIKRLADEANPYLMNKYRQNLSKNLGVELSREDSVIGVFTRLINTKVNEVPKKIIDLFLIFPAIALFGVLEIVFIILSFIYSFICWLLLIIFYKAKFYHYRKIKVDKEEIEL